MSMFSEKPAETKLLLTLLTFGVTIGGSFGVCWLTGSDPWGPPCPGACPRLLSACAWRALQPVVLIGGTVSPASWRCSCLYCLRRLRVQGSDTRMKH